MMSWITGYIAGHYALRPQPFYLGIAISVIGLLMSILAIRETRGHVAVESRSDRARSRAARLLWAASSTSRASQCQPLRRCQAGLVNNLNDGMSWGSIRSISRLWVLGSNKSVW